MKHISVFFIILAFCTCAIAQQIGSKVSFVATDGKTYTGVVKEIQGEKYKIKYDEFDFEAWLMNNQFTVTDANNDTGNNQPAMPQTNQQNITETIPQTIGEENSGQKMMTRSDSLKMSFNNIKKAFGAFNKFFTPKRDTMTIMISEIDYDNANLLQLKEKLKNVRGVKSVTMHYKSSTAIMEICYKGKATDVWDNLPPATKTAFKLMETSENNIILKQKDTQ